MGNIPLKKLFEEKPEDLDDIFYKNSKYYLKEIMKLKEDDIELYAKIVNYLVRKSELILYFRPLFRSSIKNTNFNVRIEKNGRRGRCKNGYIITYYDITFTSKNKKVIKKNFQYSSAHLRYSGKWWKIEM